MTYTTDISKLLAANIRNARDDLNMTQQDLAEKANVITLTISNIERQEVWPKPKTLQAIADALNLHPYQLFINPDEDKIVPSEALKKRDQRIMNMLASEFKTDILHPENDNSSYTISHNPDKK